jgi:hypothetical protein
MGWFPRAAPRYAIVVFGPAPGEKARQIAIALSD